MQIVGIAEASRSDDKDTQDEWPPHQESPSLPTELPRTAWDGQFHYIFRLSQQNCSLTGHYNAKVNFILKVMRPGTDIHTTTKGDTSYYYLAIFLYLKGLSYMSM